MLYTKVYANISNTNNNNNNQEISIIFYKEIQILQSIKNSRYRDPANHSSENVLLSKSNFYLVNKLILNYINS